MIYYLFIEKFYVEHLQMDSQYFELGWYPQFGGNLYGYMYLLDNWIWHLHNVKGSYITKSAENLNHEYDYKPSDLIPCRPTCI
jgi:hypothetical protein